MNKGQGRGSCIPARGKVTGQTGMHVTSVSREEVETLRRAFDFYDHDHDGRINVRQFSVILKTMFVDDPMFQSLLSGVLLECRKQRWVYFPDLLGTLVRNRHNPFYEEIWDRFISESDYQLHLVQVQCSPPHTDGDGDHSLYSVAV